MKIKTKITFWFLLPSILIATIASLFCYVYIKGTVKKNIYGQLEIAADALQERVQSFIDKKNDRTLDLASDGFIKEYTEKITGKKSSIGYNTIELNEHLILNKKSLDSSILEVFIVNLMGEVIASTNADQIGEDVSGESYYSETTASEVFIGSPQYDTNLNEVVIDFSTVLYSKRGKDIIGIIVNRIRYEHPGNTWKESTAFTLNEEWDYSKFITANKVRIVDFSSDGFIRDCTEYISMRDDNLQYSTDRLNTYLSINRLPLDQDILAIFIVDINGYIISSTEISMLRKDISNEVYFKETMKKGHYINDLHNSYEIGLNIFEVSRLLLSKEEKTPIAMIVNRYNGNSLQYITRRGIAKSDDGTLSEGLGVTGEMYIINKNKLMISESRFVEDAMLKQIVDTEAVRVAFGNKKGMIGIYTDFRGVSILGVSRYIESMDWVILAEKDVSEAFSPIVRLWYYCIIIGTVGVIILMTVAVFLAIGITRPIVKLAEGTKNISKGNLDHRLEIKSKDEIGQLADSFNDMASKLGESKKQLKDYADNLEEKVEKRTEELTKSRDNERNSREAQDVVNKLLRLTFGSLSLKELLERALKEVLSIPWLPIQTKGSIFLADESKKMLNMAAQHGLAQSVIDECCRVPYGKCLCGQAAASRSIVFAGHIDERHTTRLEEMKPHGHYCIPIISRDNLLGILNIYLAENHQRNKEEEEFLVTITHSLAGIIERKRTDEQLVYAKEVAESAALSKSNFLANMSHEIRTPMNGVIGMLELMLDTEMTAKQRNYATAIQRSSESLLSIINDILDFSKIEAGRMDLDMIAFDLQTVVEDVGHFMAVAAEQKGIQLIVRFAPDTPHRVVGDAQRTRQVLTNLVGNAIKFTEKGHVMVEVQFMSHENGKTTFRFNVEDTGIGIAPKKIKHIFDKFSQEDSSTTRKYGGTGLGLAICKQLVGLMQGFISAKSVPGEGSLFSFTVPFLLDTSNAPVADMSRADLKGLKVLIVDDNAINRQIYMELLDNWSIHCNAVESGLEALQMLRSGAEENRPYQIVLLDFNMPEMDGEALALSIKADPLIRDTLLIMLTSVSKQGEALHLEELGISACLEKPVRRALLLETLSVAWAGYQTQKATGTISLQVQNELKLKEKTNYFLNNEQRVNIHAHILLVEDNVVNQEVAIENLKHFGCTMELAVDGSEAVDMFEKNDYDLILMDCQMPVMDGFEATRKIRDFETRNSPALARTSKSGRRMAKPGGKLKDLQIASRVPIIAMTANALKGDREFCLEAGMDDYIAKPVKQKALKDILSKHLKVEVSVPPDAPKILLVDDEKGTLEIMANKIMGRYPSASIKTTSSSVQACVLIGSYLPDLLISDILMPGMDGAELVKFIRSEQRYRNIKIIVFTGIEDPDKRIQSLRDLEVKNIIHKPDYVKLISAVDSFLKPSSNRMSYTPKVEGPPSSESTEEEIERNNIVAKEEKTDGLQPLFSISDTLALVGGNVKRMKRLIDITLEDSKKQMRQLHDSLAAKDSAVVERTAHTLKGQAANVAAGPFRKAAMKMEKAAKDGDLQSVCDMMEEFEKEHRKLTKALKEIDWDSIK